MKCFAGIFFDLFGCFEMDRRTDYQNEKVQMTYIETSTISNATFSP